MSNLKSKLIKLAYDNPEIRADLLPLLKEAADTFKCPECGTKVLEKTGYCVKCKKKVKESTAKTAGVDLLEQVLPMDEVYDRVHKLKMSEGDIRLMMDVYDELRKRIDLDRNTSEALGRMMNIVSSGTRNIDDVRNQLGKAANLLGLKTPLMF